MSNREEQTRHAEKCLRLGRVDEAIAHYQDLAQLTPVDWGLVKLLADLLERTGQREGAARQFGRWADHLFAEGFHSKAAALYKKVLKLDASDEHALWQLGEVSIELKLRADARVAFQRALELRQRRGDAAGAALARERLSALDTAPTSAPSSPAMPLAYAPPTPLAAPTPIAPTPPAREPLPMARLPWLRPQEEDDEADEAPVVADPDRDVVNRHPLPSECLGDDAIGEPIVEVNVPEVGFGAEARTVSAASDVAVETAFVGMEPPVHALPAVPTLAEVSPLVLVTEAVTIETAPVFDWADLLGRDVATTWQAPTPAQTQLTDASPPHTPAAVADVDLAAETRTDAYLVEAPVSVEAEVIEVAEEPQPDGLQAVKELSEGPEPAEVYDPLEPIQPPGSMDSPLEAPSQLTDPAVPRIGDLRGQPFFGENAPLQPSFSMPSSWLSEAPVPLPPDAPRRREPGDDFFFADDATPPRWAPPAVRGWSAEMSAAAEPGPTAPVVSSDRMVALSGRPAPVGSGEPGRDDVLTPAQESFEVDEEVDLTQLLEELKQWDPELPEPRRKPAPEAAAEPSDRVSPAPPAGPLDGESAADAAPSGPIQMGMSDGSQELDAAFADLQRHGNDRTVAEQQLAAGRVFRAAGLASEAARAFERASAEPRTRFEASLALAELHRSHGQLLEATGWYEQAAMALVPDAAVKRAVLYDLAESLEALGETDRALGVLLDLLSQVEDYRDARARLDRLLRVDAGG